MYLCICLNSTEHRMNFISTKIDGELIIETRVIDDAR